MKNLISYNLLNNFPEITHFCTTRNGGVSVGNFSSFNLSPYSGDLHVSQSQNLNMLSDKIDIALNHIIFPFQTHGTEVKIINVDFLNLDIQLQTEFLNGVDALITKSSGICIGVTTADCVPLTFYDPIQRVVAVAHAGWRGTCAKIAEKTIYCMQHNFSCEPKNIRVVIGPSISVAVYNVGDDVYDAFKRERFPLSEIFVRNEGKLFLDLWKANSWILTHAGIPIVNIEIAEICSFTNQNDFFSARRLGVKSGRMLSGIMLK